MGDEDERPLRDHDLMDDLQRQVSEYVQRATLELMVLQASGEQPSGDAMKMWDSTFRQGTLKGTFHADSAEDLVAKLAEAALIAASHLLTDVLRVIHARGEDTAQFMEEVERRIHTRLGETCD